MSPWKWLLPVGATVLVGSLWLAKRNPDVQVPVEDVAAQRDSISALPNATQARLKKVRALIAKGEGEQGYEVRERIVRIASLLTDDELIAALELVAEPNYAIESLCEDEAFPLERQIKLLTHFVKIHEREGMPAALQAAAYRFAQIDPAATREWVKSFEPGIGRGQALSATD